MPLPVLLSSEREREHMLKMSPVTKVRTIAAKADLRLVGVGQMDKNAQFHVDGFINRDELLELMRLGAVGELTGWAYDADGQFIKGGTNRRLTSIPHPAPATALTVAAALGPAKVPAIFAALGGRLINGLITDEATAQALLSR
jgi:DNA-binding transcriptional regulator LsrR (DeoR family)